MSFLFLKWSNFPNEVDDKRKLLEGYRNIYILPKKEAVGEHVESKKGTLSVIEAFQKKMEEVIAVEQDAEQKRILEKALERGLQALEGRR